MSSCTGWEPYLRSFRLRRSDKRLCERALLRSQRGRIHLRPHFRSDDRRGCCQDTERLKLLHSCICRKAYKAPEQTILTPAPVFFYSDFLSGQLKTPRNHSARPENHRSFTADRDLFPASMVENGSRIPTPAYAFFWYSWEHLKNADYAGHASRVFDVYEARRAAAGCLRLQWMPVFRQSPLRCTACRQHQWVHRPGSCRSQ